MKCPTCKGFCCLNCYSDEDEKVPHVEYAEDDSYHDRGYAHVCRDCDDGTYEVCSDPEPFVPPRTALDERADVLAWLHDRVAKSYGVGTVPGTFGYNDRAIAEAFERGEHVGAAKREKT